jgi:tripartite-type tricarboxylate transporter receptor subunit TctC
MLACAVFLAIAVPAGAQQAYPNKPVRLISPNPPGGSTTFYGRLIAQKLTDAWGQQVILDNRGGGNGFIAGEIVAKSVPDGYTLEIVTGTHLIAPLLIPAPYDTIKDFVQIASFVRNETILVVHPTLPVSTLQEFIALAKSRPGQLDYATSGSGSPLHLSGVWFEQLAGVKMLPVPYKGGGPAVTDLIGGQVHASFQTPVAVIPHVRAGRLKPIAITGEKRLGNLPQVPTFAESGLPEFRSVSGSQGIIAPAGTPASIVNKIANDIAKIVAMPDFIQTLIDQGADPTYSNPEQYAAHTKADVARFAKLIKDAGIKLE